MFWVDGTVRLGIARTAVDIIVIVVNTYTILVENGIDEVVISISKFCRMLETNIDKWLYVFVKVDAISRDVESYSTPETNIE